MSPDGATLYVGAGLAAVGGVDPRHRAVLVAGGRITWTGADPTAAPPHDDLVDLGGAWLAPGFVDAHVHATATGLQAAGLDLTAASSAEDLLAAVRDHAATASHQVVYGAGWDDLGWARRPTAAELGAAAPGRTVVLVRVDGHSCLADERTIARSDLSGAELHHVERDAAGTPTGWLREGASAAALAVMRADLNQGQLDDARQAACRRALDLGITTIHEMGIPALSDRADALAWATGSWPVAVHTWWAEPSVDPSGRLRPGGDLFLDGSIGSCTAATHHPYAGGDGSPVTGDLFLADDEVADLFTAATLAGVGAGVHAIGDRAVDQALHGLAVAAERCGVDAVRAAHHRLEHVEVVTRAHVAQMARLGVVASVQPVFDALWNGPGGLYEQRFGRAAADDTNPFDWFVHAGVPLCLSSDSTVTPMDPWGGVVAAERHHGGHGIDRATALAAATLGGHLAAGAADEVGPLAPGMRADLVAWPADPLTAADPSRWTPIAVIARGALVRS